MKKIILQTMLAVGLIAGFVSEGKATHISGGNFEYQCVGQDSFLITMNVFRFCDGAGMPGSVSIDFTSPCGGGPGSVTLQQDSIIEVSQLCESELPNSQCASPPGSLPGMQHGFFSGIVELPPCSQGPWVMSYNVCCRNSTANLQGTATQGPQMTIDAELNNYEAPCNNSPKFEGQPIPYVCDGAPVNYSFGAVDTDGDSLHFVLEHPLANNINDPAPYNPGYSPVNPLNVPVTLNSSTGQFSFTPQYQPGEPFYVVKICAEEYRNGVYIGKVCRDIQFNVQQCDNVTPWMSSNGITNFSGDGVQIDSNTVELCVGNTISFDVIFEDSLTPSQGTIGDSITLTSNVSSVLPGATVTITNGNPATFSITWTATQTSGALNTFTIDIIDDACPIPGIGSFAFSIVVVPSTYAGPDIEVCEDDTAFVDVVGGSDFTWSVLSGTEPIIPGINFSDTVGSPDQNVWMFKSTTTTYEVVSNLSSTCDNRDTITITRFERYDAGFVLDTPYCVTDIPDTAEAITDDPKGVWSGPGITDDSLGIFAPGEAGTGMIPITYQIESGQGNCNTDSTYQIRVVELPDPSIDAPEALCFTGGPYSFDVATPGGFWFGPAVTDSTTGEVDPSAALSAAGSVPIYYELEVPCFNRDTVNVLFYQDVDFDLIDTPLYVCDYDTANLEQFVSPIEIGPTAPNQNYNWLGSGIPDSDVGFFDASLLSDQDSIVTVTVEGTDDRGQCATQKDMRIFINNPIQPEIIAGMSFCSDIEQVSIQTSPSIGLGNWQIRPVGSTTKNLQMDPNRPGRIFPEDLGSGTWEFMFTYTDLNGCVADITDTIRILDTPERPEIDSTNFCVGDRMVFESSFENHPDSIIWYENENLAGEGTGESTPYFHGIASIDDRDVPIYAVERNGVCTSEPGMIRIPVRPSPDADFTMSFLDSNEVEQTMDRNSMDVRGRAPFLVAFEATEIEPGQDSLFLWDLWFDCNEADGVDGQPCPIEFDGPAAEQMYEKEGVYEVQLIKVNTFGCSDTTNGMVTVLFQGKIPNVFTPNGDKTNDVFYIPGATALRDFKLVIYNRWGRKVEEITDASPQNGWTGDGFPEGTYYFVATGTRGNGEDFIEKGDITLLR